MPDIVLGTMDIHVAKLCRGSRDLMRRHNCQHIMSKKHVKSQLSPSYRSSIKEGRKTLQDLTSGRQASVEKVPFDLSFELLINEWD